MIHRHIIRWASHTPHKAALIFNSVTYTYRDLARMVAEQRSVCAQTGLGGPGIAIVAIRDLLHIWIACAALRSLGLTTVVAPPDASLDPVLALPDVRVVVESARYRRPDVMAACTARQMPLAMLPVPHVADGDPAGAMTQDTLSGGHVLQTSGTTGTPKFVLIDPAWEAAFAQKRIDLLGLNADTRFIAFDFPPWAGAGYKAVLCTWMVGGTVIMGQDRPYHEALRTPGLTHGAIVPAMLRNLLDAPDNAFARSDMLQLGITGGGTSAEQIAMAKARITPHLSNRIGATETSTFACTDLRTSDDLLWQQPVPGQMEIVDDDDRPIAFGAIGLIRVSTENGPKGYLADAATSALFFRNGYFYPGDLAKLREDGRFALQGRATDVLNIGGFKFAPGPLESRLCDLLGVPGVCILSVSEGNGETRLHVTVESDTPFDEEAVRHLLREEFGTFGEAHLQRLKRLPRNAMGKVLRDALRADIMARQSAPAVHPTATEDSSLIGAELIFAAAAKTPDKTALVYNDEPLSYRAFAAAIRGARNLLTREKIVGPGLAAVAVRTLPDFWTVSLALRHLGLTVVPLSDMTHVASLDLPDIRFVITTARESWTDLAVHCASRRLPLLAINWSADDSSDVPAPVIAPGGQVLRTSGTTGAYKHVLMHPSFEARFLRAKLAVQEFTSDTRSCVFHFPPWSGGGYDGPLCAWTVGATVVFQQDRPIHHALRDGRLTYATLNPAMLTDVLAAPPDAFSYNPRLSLTLTGGSVSDAQIAQIRARLTSRIFNRLGATETGMFASTPVVDSDNGRLHRPVPYKRVSVVDEAGRAVSAGTQGRLRVSIADGPDSYFHDPATTRAQFQGGFFYTGDLAIMREDGCFTLQGREGDVINVGGYKMTPVPIEEKLCTAFGFRGVCLMSLVGEDGGEDIYVVIESDGQIDNDTLGEALRRDLGPFPNAHIFYTQKLPRNEGGKLARETVKSSIISGLRRPSTGSTS